jgi:hypothetical protein
MESQAGLSISQSSVRRLWPWLLVLVVLVFIASVRLRLLDMPLERDEGEYAYAGQLILQGVPPYELVYNMKLPGTYYVCALGVAVFGQTSAGIHLTLLVANALAIVFVFLLGRALFGVTAGLVACASYGIMSLSPSVLGLAAHATHFVVVFALAALWLMWRADKDDRPKLWFLSGLLYGLAFLMKQQGFCFCLFGVLFLVWRSVADKSILSAAFARRAMVFTAGIFLPFALQCFASFIAGDFASFWFWTFSYAKWYAAYQPLQDGIKALAWHLQDSWSVSLGFWILLVLGLPLAWFNGAARRPLIFVALLWLCSFVGTATGLYFRDHYFILLLPAFALLVGAAVDSMCRVSWFPLHGRIVRIIPVCLFLLVVGWSVLHERSMFFELTPVMAVQSIYRANPFAEAQVTGTYVREHSAPDERIAVIGSEPEIYFYARRSSVTGYIYTYPMMEPHSAAVAMQRDMIWQIQTNHPSYLLYVPNLLSWAPHKNSSRELLNWFHRYSTNQCVRVGAVALDAKGEATFFPESELARTSVLARSHIEIFQRKPDTSLISH